MNQILREVISEQLVRLGDVDERLGMLTVTDVVTAQDLKSAVVYFDTLSDAATEALEEYRVEIQGSVNAQTRMKRTPRLSFAADPAVAAGTQVEEIIRRLRRER